MSREKEDMAWPEITRASMGAPNVVVFLTDDVGFGASSTFGGPVPTSALDRLAERGVRFNQFHTAAICSPTRASLLTGRNPHRVNMGGVANRPTGFEGYTTNIPKSCGTVAETLRRAGYSTAMFGKGHITPEWEMSQAGPFDRWPTGLGFDHFYGFLGFDANMFAPALVENTSFIDPPADDDDYHFDRDLADRTIRWINQQKAVAPSKPFFAYYATGTAHAPHQAPANWLAKFRGKFDHGWDRQREDTFHLQKDMGIIPADAKLTPRPDILPSWDSQSDQEKSVAARLMEAFAASLSHADYQMGRVIDELDAMGELDSTLIIFLQGDNGGSADCGVRGTLFEQSLFNRFEEDPQYVADHIDEIGGPLSYTNYPASWGWAVNTPFQFYKQVASHFGGTRNGLVVSWHARVPTGGEVRSQFHHVVDILPTILEAAGVELPAEIDGIAQDGVDGVSMLYAMQDADAPSQRRVQVFECIENFALYADGWLACSRPKDAPWVSLYDRVAADPYSRTWELYHLPDDYSQAHDLAARKPKKLREMQELFWIEAEKNKILPIHPLTEGVQGRPELEQGRTEYNYRARVTRIPVEGGPNTVGRSFRISAELSLSDAPASGVVMTQGGRFGGMALFLKEGRPVFHYNALPPVRVELTGETALTAGTHQLDVSFEAGESKPGTSGHFELSVDGKRVATASINRTLRTFMNAEGLNIGRDTLTPVCEGYSITESEFSGDIGYVRVRLR